MRVTWMALVVVLAAGAALLGCPKNTCLFKYCENGRCTCPISTCVDGAEFDVKRNRCVCERQRIPLGGGCLTPRQADAYCGRGFRWTPQGCQRLVCPPGQAFDEATGRCRSLNDVAGRMGVQVGHGQKLGCPPGTRLVLDGDAAACVPESQTCARDETWDGQRCVKTVQCPTGSVWDAARRQCVAYTRQGDDAPTVQVQQWTWANYGPPGGRGTDAFCSQFARKPWSFGIQEGQSAMIRVAVVLSFPDRNVAAGRVTTSATYALHGKPVPPRGAAEVQGAAENIFATLRGGGGRADVPTANTTVDCAVVNGAKPAPVPATGGM